MVKVPCGPFKIVEPSTQESCGHSQLPSDRISVAGELLQTARQETVTEGNLVRIQAEHVAESEEQQGSPIFPDRRLDCQHYETCLEVAASLDWAGFACSGCSGQVDQVLLWRSHGAKRRDPVAQMICSNTPPIAVIDGSADQSSSLVRIERRCEPPRVVSPRPSHTHAPHPKRAKR